jgi:hypothetical protein
MFYHISSCRFSWGTLGKDKIHVPPCNYVFLEVVDHGD